MDIHFISSNEFKINEVREIMLPHGIQIIAFKHKLDELQTTDNIAIVKDKALKAFKKIGKPLIVEHTGLKIDRINGLPDGLTQIFWDRLQADQFSSLLGGSKASAHTIICYCDGLKFHYFEGEITGQISDTPKGNRDFQWDCVFIPEGYNLTFAELGDKKNDISMRRIALEGLLKHVI